MPTVPPWGPSEQGETPTNSKAKLKAIIKWLLWDVYTVDRYPNLAKYKDVLKNDTDIIGEGNFGIMVQTEDFGIGLKVLKQERAEIVFEGEAKRQEDFRALLEFGKSDAWGKEIPEYIHIPQVMFENEKYRGLPAFQVIEGNSLLGVLNKKRYRHVLAQFLSVHGWDIVDIDKEIIAMTDFELHVILLSEGIDPITRMMYWDFLLNGSIDTYIWGSPFVYGKPPVEKVDWPLAQAGLKVSAEQLDRDLQKVFAYFEEHGYYHKDEMWGNIMIWKDGKVFIIDFWVSKIEKT